MAFSFENLEVYQNAIQFSAEIEAVIARGKLPRTLAEPLSRAALSICLNIAEANCRRPKKDRRSFFWIARRSVLECISILEILALQSAVSSEERHKLRLKLEHLAEMLSHLAQKQFAQEKSSEQLAFLSRN